MAQNNNAFTDPTYGTVALTPDATPQTILSIGPIDSEKIVFAEIFVAAIRISDWGAGFAGRAQSLFARRTGSALARVGTAPAPTVFINNLGLTATSVALNANAATQTIDVVVTGQAGVPIQWWVELNLKVTQ